MKRQWEAGELIEHFTLLPHEQEMLPTLGNTTAPNQLGFAARSQIFPERRQVSQSAARSSQSGCDFYCQTA